MEKVGLKMNTLKIDFQWLVFSADITVKIKRAYFCKGYIVDFNKCRKFLC